MQLSSVSNAIAVPTPEQPSDGDRTLNRLAQPLPTELLFRISAELSRADLCAVVQVSKHVHDVASTILYHTIETTHRNAHRIFSALLLRFQDDSRGHIRNAPTSAVRCLSYVSISVDDDLRVFPLLCDVLLRTSQLRHLYLDAADRSVPALSALLKRRGLARIPPSPVYAAFYCSMERVKRISTTLTLPRLVGLHVSSHKILGELGRFRGLRSIFLDEGLCHADMINVLEKLCEGGMGERVTAFTCVCGDADGDGLLWAIATAFPNLTFLGLVFAEEIIPHLYPSDTMFKLSVSPFAVISPKVYSPRSEQWIMRFLRLHLYVFDNLDVLSLDFSWPLSVTWANFIDRVRWDRLEPILTSLLKVRPNLERFFFACAEVVYDGSRARWDVRESARDENGAVSQRRFATAGTCRQP